MNDTREVFMTRVVEAAAGTPYDISPTRRMLSQRVISGCRGQRLPRSAVGADLEQSLRTASVGTRWWPASAIGLGLLDVVLDGQHRDDTFVKALAVLDDF